MLYIKIMDGENVVGAEAHDNPVYVCRQSKNNIIVRCPEIYAQGILSLDCSSVYQLYGKDPISTESAFVAYPIFGTEYETIISGLSPVSEDDADDQTPDVDSADDTAVLTRAELTERVMALEDELRAAKILLGVE